VGGDFGPVGGCAMVEEWVYGALRRNDRAKRAMDWSP
jgi:hypothetical protein